MRVEDDLQYGWSKWWFRQSTCCSPAINQDADPVHNADARVYRWNTNKPINHIIADTPVELVQIQSWVWIQYTRKFFACLLVKTNLLLRYLSLLTKTYCISRFNCISPCFPRMFHMSNHRRPTERESQYAKFLLYSWGSKPTTPLIQQC